MTDASTVNSRLTVALVHGAFADSSGWNDVVEQLQAAGIAVQAGFPLPAWRDPLKGEEFSDGRDAEEVRCGLP
jgi:hypothetical protein